GHVAEVAVQSLDAWYSKDGMRNGNVRIIQRDVPRSVRKLTPDLEALARKGRAHRSIDSLLRRNPQHLVAGAGAYMVSATVAALADQRDATFESVLDELLPEQQVSEPVPAPTPVAKPAKTSATETTVATSQQHATATETTDRTTTSAERNTAVDRTRCMAAVKELQQWGGKARLLSGSLRPNPADIKNIAATIGITGASVDKKQDPKPAPAAKMY